MRPTLPTVIATVCECYGIEPRELHGRTRHRHHTEAREQIVLLALDRCHASLMDVSRALGRSGHTTMRGAERRARQKVAEHHPSVLPSRSFADVQVQLRIRLDVVSPPPPPPPAPAVSVVGTLYRRGVAVRIVQIDDRYGVCRIRSGTRCELAETAEEALRKASDLIHSSTQRKAA